MICPYCKTETGDDQEYCPGCGRKIDREDHDQNLLDILEDEKYKDLFARPQEKTGIEIKPDMELPKNAGRMSEEYVQNILEADDKWVEVLDGPLVVSHAEVKKEIPEVPSTQEYPTIASYVEAMQEPKENKETVLPDKQSEEIRFEPLPTQSEEIQTSSFKRIRPLIYLILSLLILLLWNVGGIRINAFIFSVSRSFASLFNEAGSMGSAFGVDGAANATYLNIAIEIMAIVSVVLNVLELILARKIPLSKFLPVSLAVMIPLTVIALFAGVREQAGDIAGVISLNAGGWLAMLVCLATIIFIPFFRQQKD